MDTSYNPLILDAYDFLRKQGLIKTSFQWYRLQIKCFHFMDRGKGQCVSTLSKVTQSSPARPQSAVLYSGNHFFVLCIQ